jgi:hypothetical protein
LYGSKASSSSSRLLSNSLFGILVTQRHHIWQMHFLEVDKLAEFSQKHGLVFFENKDIPLLWQLGFLQADMVICSRKIHYPGLIEQSMDEHEKFVYSDNRQLPAYTGIWEDLIAKLEPLSPDIHLFFHPFRYYVLAQLEEELARFRLVQRVQFPLQSYSVPDITSFQSWANYDSFKEELQKWNDVASLAILAEPCFYGSIFHHWSTRPPINFEMLRERINSHWQDVEECYKNIAIKQLKETHREVCNTVRRLDPNSVVHTILRLGSGDVRMKLEGRLGGAMHVRCLAEVIRRATEEAFETTLAEEDERGIGEFPKEVKRNLYGSNRLLDGDRLIAQEFLRQQGLLYSLRLRWYVEGDTEWGALDAYFKEIEVTDIEIINLRAHVAQKAGRGLGFRDSLRSDMSMHIFSFISIDGDRSDFASAVRKAAEDDEICGAFFIPEKGKDFEFENFDLAELEEILWDVATENVENHTDEVDRQRLLSSIEGAKNSTDLINRAKGALPQLAHLKKDPNWGMRLINYAMQHRFKREKKRQIVEAIEYALFLARTVSLESYQGARKRLRIDKNTGRLIPRNISSDDTGALPM